MIGDLAWDMWQAERNQTLYASRDNHYRVVGPLGGDIHLYKRWAIRRAILDRKLLERSGEEPWTE